jgi:hypothetical protein
VSLASLAGCARPARTPAAAPGEVPGAPPGAALVAQLARGPVRVVARTAVDSDVVRRLCVAPDSVLSGRAACVLKAGAAFRVF